MFRTSQNPSESFDVQLLVRWNTSNPARGSDCANLAGKPDYDAESGMVLRDSPTAHLRPRAEVCNSDETWFTADIQVDEESPDAGWGENTDYVAELALALREGEPAIREAATPVIAERTN